MSATEVGVSDKWPKSKCQNFKSTQWFSYKIWTKNSEEPIVYLNNWPLPEQHHFLKLQWKIHFLTFLTTDRNAPKKFRIEIWTFSFQICFWNQFSTLGSGQIENMQIRVFALSTPWVNVYTKSPCLYQESLPIKQLYHESKPILWVQEVPNNPRGT